MNSGFISDEIERVSVTQVFGVTYSHISFNNGDDLYLTEYGVPFIANLMPENFWTDNKWFKNHSKKLRGTSTVYKVTTKKVKGKSKNIVLKWNRMGQDIPGETDLQVDANVEFNSPFEEFALALELRDARHHSSDRLLTHKPLAIYVPEASVKLAQLGRKSYKMEALISSHAEIELNMFRNYAVIYEWIKGVDAVQAFEMQALNKDDLVQLIARSDNDIKNMGFFVADPKPHHLIVRPGEKGTVSRNGKGGPLYALIDFELLKRTPEREKEVQAVKRKNYLKKQVHRFESKELLDLPPNLKSVNIMDVDYIYGPVEGTSAGLWVVGKDPALFDYFLPVKWRKTPRTKLSYRNQVYRTTTKDNIHLVWKVSRVGEQPDMDPFKEDEQKIIQFGYNSPFEEVALAIELSNKGIATIYPRAIYMTSSKSQVHDSFRDDSRYKSHKDTLTPKGKPALMEGHDYIIIWGYWNGPDEFLAARDESPYQGIDALFAYRNNLLDKDTYMQLVQIANDSLAKVGIEDLNLRGSHLLLSLDRSGKLVRDNQQLPEMRICNFELLKQAHKV
jgi:hypothetical protein